MPSSNRSTEVRRGDDGSATLEFLGGGLLLLVPLVSLVITLAQLEAASFAADGAARHAARVVAASDSADAATAAAGRAVELAMEDWGLSELPVHYRLSCAPAPDDCVAPRGIVRVELAIEVPIPLVPPGIAAALPAALTVSATAVEQRSRFGAAP